MKERRKEGEFWWQISSPPSLPRRHSHTLDEEERNEDSPTELGLELGAILKLSLKREGVKEAGKEKDVVGRSFESVPPCLFEQLGRVDAFLFYSASFTCFSAPRFLKNESRRRLERPLHEILSEERTSSCLLLPINRLSDEQNKGKNATRGIGPSVPSFPPCSLEQPIRKLTE